MGRLETCHRTCRVVRGMIQLLRTGNLEGQSVSNFQAQGTSSTERQGVNMLEWRIYRKRKISHAVDHPKRATSEYD